MNTRMLLKQLFIIFLSLTSASKLALANVIDSGTLTPAEDVGCAFGFGPFNIGYV